MQNTENHLQTLSEIKNLMERSSRFISLSGLSGVAAGIFALIGAWAAHHYAGIPFDNQFVYNTMMSPRELDLFLLLDALIVLVLATGFGIFFTARKAKLSGLKVWDRTTERLLINLLLPLVAGGIFCLILMLKYHEIGLIAPVTLIFYGLGLINASKYTLNDIRNLGILEIILGLIGTYHIHYGLLIWAIGFGVLHIIYGLAMYFKYERKNS
jgi:hypothetical protein